MPSRQSKRRCILCCRATEAKTMGLAKQRLEILKKWYPHLKSEKQSCHPRCLSMPRLRCEVACNHGSLACFRNTQLLEQLRAPLPTAKLDVRTLVGDVVFEDTQALSREKQRHNTVQIATRIGLRFAWPLFWVYAAWYPRKCSENIPWKQCHRGCISLGSSATLFQRRLCPVMNGIVSPEV